MSIIGQFLRHPFLTGAVVASSRRLANEMTEGIGIEDASLVVELGGGTGAITEAILPRMSPDAQLVVVELNPALASHLADKYRGRPVHVINGSAADLDTLLPGTAGAVVSGLPWTVMPDSRQQHILDSVGNSLCRDGQFTTFAYLHVAHTQPAQRFNLHLADRFGSVERSSTVWSNFPPAFVHRAAKPQVRPERELAQRVQ